MTRIILGDTCKVCKTGVQSFNGGQTWVHHNGESRCPSPGYATPNGDWGTDRATQGDS